MGDETGIQIEVTDDQLTHIIVTEFMQVLREPEGRPTDVLQAMRTLLTWYAPAKVYEAFFEDLYSEGL